MTTDKAFKRVVRARMARTGERYAAARRALLEGATDGHHAEPTADATSPSGYRMRGGLPPETAGWTAKTLDRLGIEPDLHETGGAKGAREALDARLDAGLPVIASIDPPSGGAWGLPRAPGG